MLLLLEKDGPARVAAGQVGSVGGDDDRELVEREEHMDAGYPFSCMQVGSLAISWKVDDSDMIQIAGMQPGTLCYVPQTGKIRAQSSSEQQPAAVRRAV